MKSKRYEKTMNISTLLQTSNLAQVMKKGLLIHELNQKIQTFFPPQFQGLYRLANFTENSLHIDVANATVRQALLFQQNELLRIVQQELPEITALQFRINPALGLK